jgi:signal peptidase II
MAAVCKRFLPLAFGAAAVVLIDQAVKFWVLKHLSPVYPRPVIEGFLSLVLVRNTGIAFGIFGASQAVWKTAVLVLLALLMLALLGWYYMVAARPARLSRMAVTLVAGGAVGNLIDRLRFGAVIDFIDLHCCSYHWPAFNVADAAISIGVVMLLLLTVVGQRG